MKQTHLTITIVSGGFLLASLLLGFSIWKNVEDQALEAVLPKNAVVAIENPHLLADYDNKLPLHKPILPDKPWYVVMAAEERLQLWWAREPEQKFAALMVLADKRMKASQLLYEAGKGNIALKTCVKGVYYWESAQRLLAAHDPTRKDHPELWLQLRGRAEVYQGMLTLMKEGMNGLAQEGLNVLIEAIETRKPTSY